MSVVEYVFSWSCFKSELVCAGVLGCEERGKKYFVKTRKLLGNNRLRV